MIQGNKPSGYFSTFDSKTGKKIEGETRMCVHCQMKWIYKMGSGKRRGYCQRCNGLLCGKDLCMRYCIPYIDKIEAIEKGLKLNDMLKIMNKKYGSNIIGKTHEL